jgi:PKD repeat protein
MGFGNVTVNNPPAATFSYSGSPYCHNAVNPTPTFSGGGSAGTFTSTAGLVINSSTGQVNVLSSTPGTYTVTNTIAASGGCSAVSANSNITIVPLPNITVNSLSICSGGNDTLTAAGASTYSWSPSAGLSSATGSSPIASPSSTTSYTVTGTLNGCTSTAIATVTVNPLPTVNGGPDQSACAGSPVSFSAASNGTSYLWAFGDGVNSSALSPSHTYSAAGAYTATLTATSAAGCSLTDNVTITVNPLPAVFSTSNDVSCFGMCNGSVTATSPGSTFLWIPGNQTTAGISGLCAGVYSVVVTNANGCNAYDTVSITEPAALAVNPTSSPASCFGTSSGSATASPTGGTPLYTYLWSPSGQTTATASALAAGSHTITITDASGCTANSAVVITQPSDVTVTASLPDTICTGSNTMLTSVASGGTPPYVTYTWNDGSSNFSSAPATTVSPAVNTYYTISIIDANGCAGTNNTTVTVYPPANIYGHVTYSGGSLGTGTNAVVLYDHLSVLTTFDTVMTTTLDAGGNYYFASVPPGDYLVKVFNDTAAYPLASPTYYGDEFLWDSASVINHDCSSNFVANIVMVEASLLSGPGHVDGQVTEGDGFGRAPGDPIPGVDIKLGRNPGGQMIASTETDASGNYSFDNIPLNIAGENYVIYADIPGLERVSIYNFVVDGSITQYYDMDYEADSSTVYTTQTSVGVNIIKSNQVQFKIYPNPSTGNISISAVLEKNAKVRVEVYNVLGEMVIAPFSCDRQKGEFLQNIETDLQPGVYFVSLAIDNSTSLQRLIITR